LKQKVDRVCWFRRKMEGGDVIPKRNGSTTNQARDRVTDPTRTSQLPALGDETGLEKWADNEKEIHLSRTKTQTKNRSHTTGRSGNMVGADPGKKKEKT